MCAISGDKIPQPCQAQLLSHPTQQAQLPFSRPSSLSLARSASPLTAVPLLLPARLLPVCPPPPARGCCTHPPRRCACLLEVNAPFHFLPAVAPHRVWHPGGPVLPPPCPPRNSHFRTALLPCEHRASSRPHHAVARVVIRGAEPPFLLYPSRRPPHMYPSHSPFHPVHCA